MSGTEKGFNKSQKKLTSKCLGSGPPVSDAQTTIWVQGVCLGSDPRKYQKGVEK